MNSIFGGLQMGKQLGDKPNSEELVSRGLVSALTETAPSFLLMASGLNLVNPALIRACVTYRVACRLAFSLRRVPGMTARSVAELSGIHPPHIGDYLARQSRRDMPAKYVYGFEKAVGNTAVSQWLAWAGGLSVAEEDAFSAQRGGD